MKYKAEAPSWRLIEVWGDTADTRHLGAAIVIGAVVSLAGFLLASRILAGLVATPELARAYAMLAGLGGCLLAGVICGLMFAPKRHVIDDDAAGLAGREEVLDQLAAQPGGLGETAELPAAVARELRELQLFDLFAARERRGPGAAAGRADSMPPHSNAALADPQA